MAKNQVYDGPMREIDLNVGASTFTPGAPVKVGIFVGVCQTPSDGGAAAGYVPTNGGARYQAVNHSTVALRGGHRLSVLFTLGVPAQGLPLYITSSNTLTDVAAGNTLFGAYYDSVATGNGTFSVIVILAGSVG